MSLSSYLQKNGINPKDIKKEATSLTEIADLFMMVERDLKDSQNSKNISIDWQFGIAYNAALKLCSILIRSEGLRVSSGPHHMITFKLMPHFLGDEKISLSRFFDKCRVKRNQLEYERIGGVSEKELKELIEETKKLKQNIRDWIFVHHLELMTDNNG